MNCLPAHTELRRRSPHKNKKGVSDGTVGKLQTMMFLKKLYG